MTTAIMGAGLAGLSCALFLEKNGHTPVIFEKRSEVGDRFVNGEIMLSILSFPVKDEIQYLADNYNIYLRPLNHINTLFLHSENKKTEITGQLGFTTLRGRKENSLEKQLAARLQAKIIFNSVKTYHNLLQEFDRVVVATGDALTAHRLNNYKKDFTATLIGALITGNFNTGTVRAWLNNNLAPRGYGYLIPLSPTTANIVIGFPDHRENQTLDYDLLWSNFLQTVKETLDRDFKITDHFHITGYMFGSCLNPRIGNSYFVGNNFGALMPFLGFGQFTSILTGIYTALDILGKGDFLDLLSPLKKSYQDSLILRRTLEKMNNRSYDRLVGLLATPAGQKLFTSKFNYLHHISKLLKLKFIFKK